MASLYFDSSAVVKRYATEAGSTWIQTLTIRQARHVLFTVRVTGPEVIVALMRKARVGELSRSRAAQAAADFRVDWASQYVIVEVDPQVTSLAMDLAERHGLRGYDAVHLAAAVDVHRRRSAQRMLPLTFISTDGDQLRVASLEGLPVDDPNSHP